MLGTFGGVQYRYRCAWCLEPMTATSQGSLCEKHGLCGGFWLTTYNEPETVSSDHRASVSVKKYKRREWRWAFGDEINWNQLTKAKA